MEEESNKLKHNLAANLDAALGIDNLIMRGTREQPCMDLGQGSGGSNPGFTLTAAPMIRTYKGKKFPAELKSAWSGLVMILAAIMYVDNMDMLLRAKKSYNRGIL